MVTITFADRETARRALGFLIGRFSSRVLKTGEHIVPEAALEALAYEGIPFTLQGKTTYDQMAPFRGAVPASVQRRKSRPARVARRGRTGGRRAV